MVSSGVGACLGVRGIGGYGSVSGLLDERAQEGRTEKVFFFFFGDYLTQIKQSTQSRRKSPRTR